MRSVLRGLLLAAAALAALPAAAEEKKPEPDKEDRREHEEAVKKAVDEFKTAVREAKSPAERAAAVKRLAAAERDPKLVSELSRLLADADLVSNEVMQALAVYRREKAAANALLAVLPAFAKKPAQLQQALETLGDIGLESTLPTVARYVQDDSDAVVGSAIRALGGMNCIPAVDTVLAVWEEIERSRKKGGAAKTKGDQRMAALGPVMKEALARLTGQKYHFVEEHRAWWAQNRASFKPKEEPNVLCHHLGGPPPGSPPTHLAVARPGDAVNPAAAPPGPGGAAPAAMPPAAISRIQAPLLRAVNLNGPALMFDGHDWESGAAPADLSIDGGSPYEFKSGPVTPATDEPRARLLRTGQTSDGALTLTFRNLSNVPCFVCIYIWEDAAAQLFDVKIQGTLAASNFSTGGAGRWTRLGPWPATVVDGALTIAFAGGAVNVSAVAVYRRSDPVAPAAATETAEPPAPKAGEAKPEDEARPAETPPPAPDKPE
jgi:hypothetical protein